MILRGSIPALRAAVPVLATSLLLDCAAAPPRTTAERAVDDRIVAQVEAALSADPEIYARHIDVSVDRGVVRLGGFVWEERDFLRARKDTESVPGVSSVDNELELFRGGKGTNK